jgi:non-ribosomal peptide synthetase component E (peptide arylation enzyme)
MLEGVVPFPPELARRYRERGYWRDKSLAEEFKPWFERYRERIAIIDRERALSYGELDRLSSNLALNLLHAGLKPLDRVSISRFKRSAAFRSRRWPLTGTRRFGSLSSSRAQVRAYSRTASANSISRPW